MKSVVLAFFLATSFFTTSSYGEPTNLVEISDDPFKEVMLNAILQSQILNYFWAGDDGIDCGEPELDLLSVNYSEKKVVLAVHPAAQAHSCESRSMICEINFIENASGSISLIDKPVLPSGAGCY